MYTCINVVEHVHACALEYHSVYIHFTMKHNMYICFTQVLQGTYKSIQGEFMQKVISRAYYQI
jgi:hypothetical protein